MCLCKHVVIFVRGESHSEQFLLMNNAHIEIPVVTNLISDNFSSQTEVLA